MSEFKPFDYGNVLATGEAIKGQQAQNALLKARTDAIPQEQRQRDLEIELTQSQLTDRQKANAAGVLANRFSAVAQSSNPKLAAQQFLSDPNFAAAGQVLGLPIDQFTIGEQDTDDSIRASATDWARALGQQIQKPNGQYKLVSGPNGALLQINLETGAVTPVLGREPNQTGEPLVSVVGPDNKPVLLPRSQAAGMQPFQKPTGGLSPRDATTARQKLTQINLARQQLALVREKFNAIKGSLSAGPGGQYLPTQAGQAFDTAVDSMRNVLTTITRVPGVGSMSDFETRLAQAQFPSRGKYEANTEQQISSLEQMLSALETGYGGLLGEEEPSAAGDLSGLSDEELMRIVNGE